MTLADAITKLSAYSDLDDLGMDILAAATTLRDSTGRDRVNALRSMCRAWGVGRRQKIAGQWKDRGLPVLESLLYESVCLAAARWQRNLHGQTEQRGVSEHAASKTAKHDAPRDGEEVEDRGVARHTSADSSSVDPLDGRSGAGKADQRIHVRDDASPSHAGFVKKG